MRAARQSLGFLSLSGTASPYIQQGFCSKRFRLFFFAAAAAGTSPY